MIKLTKGPEPQVLKDNAATWLQNILDKEANGEEVKKEDLNKYTHPKIKGALVAETSGKCAYCESKFMHVTYGDVEHITPKKLGHSYRYQWANLTIACDVCNTGKGSKEDIVDPYTDNIADMFSFFGAFLFSKPDHDKAYFTEKSLKLNRSRLLEKRGERLSRISELVRSAMAMSDQSKKDVLLSDIKDNELSEDTEYAAFTRSFYTHLINDGVVPLQV